MLFRYDLHLHGLRPLLEHVVVLDQPGVLSKFLHADPSLGVELQTLAKHVQTGRTDCLLDDRVYLVLSGLDGLDYFIVICALERESSM
jgi:hypothetical protein